MTYPKILPLVLSLAAVMLCGQARAEVLSYTLGIHTNCPYGLAR